MVRSKVDYFAGVSYHTPMSKCIVKRCVVEVVARGLCRKHYHRWRKGLDVGISMKKREASVCKVTDCSRYVDILATGLCSAHYQRVQKYGVPLEHVPIIKKDGEPYLDPDGYVVFKKRFMHRILMERKLQRSLLKTETVHHKNGIRNDNRMKNLELWSVVQPRGQRVSDKVRFANEIINQYGDDPKEYE